MCTLRQVTLSSNLATLQDDRRAQKDLTRRTLVKRDLDKQLLRSRRTPIVRRIIGIKGAGVRPPYAGNVVTFTKTSNLEFRRPLVGEDGWTLSPTIWNI